MRNTADKAVHRLKRAISNMVARAVLTLPSDAAGVQGAQIQLLGDETRDAERFQNYGFTSVPQAGAEAVVAFPGGVRDHALVLAVDDRRFRLRGLAGGEVAVYTDEGDKIVLKRGGTIEVTAATEVKIIAPKVTIEGDLHVIGELYHGAGTGSSLWGTYNTHTHPETGSVTQPPNQEMP